MFARSLALAAGAALLIGAAPVQDAQIRSALECKLPRAQMLAAMKRFPVRKVDDASEAPDRRIITIYTSPANVIAYGFPATLTGSADILSSEDERVLLMGNIKAPYADVLRAVLAAHGRAKCDATDVDDDGQLCGLSFAPNGEWEASIAIKEYPDTIGISCAYSRASQ
jgi:hypothetical protein